MDSSTLPIPGFEAGAPVPKEQQLANPNFTVAETPRTDEHHNMELPTVVPVNPAQAAKDVASQAVPLGLAQIVPVAPGAVPSAAPTTPVSDDMAADDVDIIEKAWIDKAKSIVAQTRNDPYLQNKEINKIKADYIKKRYNKDVKLNED